VRLPPEQHHHLPALIQQQKERLLSACPSPSAAGHLLVPSLQFLLHGCVPGAEPGRTAPPALPNSNTSFYGHGLFQGPIIYVAKQQNRLNPSLPVVLC
jgi:hypothetical protein